MEHQDETDITIRPEVEFWGHCSNLQVWFECNYDTRLLHRGLAFLLLRKLTEVGDPINYNIKIALLDTCINDLNIPILEYHEEFERLDGIEKNKYLIDRTSEILEALQFYWTFQEVEFHEWYEGAFEREVRYIKGQGEPYQKDTSIFGLNKVSWKQSPRLIRVPLYDVAMLISFGLSYSQIHGYMKTTYNLKMVRATFLQIMYFHFGTQYEAQKKYMSPIISGLYKSGYTTKDIISIFKDQIDFQSTRHSWLASWYRGFERIEVEGIARTDDLDHSIGIPWKAWFSWICKDLRYNEIRDLVDFDRNYWDIWLTSFTSHFQIGDRDTYNRRLAIKEVRRAFSLLLLSKGASFRDIYTKMFGLEFTTEAGMLEFFGDLFPDISLESLRSVCLDSRIRLDRSRFLNMFADPEWTVMNHGLLEHILNIYWEKSLEDIIEDPSSFFNLFLY